MSDNTDMPLDAFEDQPLTFEKISQAMREGPAYEVGSGGEIPADPPSTRPAPTIQEALAALGDSIERELGERVRHAAHAHLSREVAKRASASEVERISRGLNDERGARRRLDKGMSEKVRELEDRLDGLRTEFQGILRKTVAAAEQVRSATAGIFVDRIKPERLHDDPHIKPVQSSYTEGDDPASFRGFFWGLLLAAAIWGLTWVVLS